ncbi:N-acetylneuraminate synthase family protein [Candidatus Parcubacteria bacterium]|nr:N-acetylneuraminate synthase family protein [Candidatus Parcubacteria bacterium]
MDLIYKKPEVVAEIGCNHKGDIAIAKEMIKMAKLFCGVNIVKFQKRNNKELLTPAEYNTPHPSSENSYGQTYGDHREFLEFTKDQHKELKEYCDKIGIEYSCSVWDLTSAKEIISLNPKRIKIPSACNLKMDLLSYVRDNFNGEIHLSLGMTTRAEEDLIVQFFVDKGRNKDIILYACTSGYPVAINDLCLLEIRRLKNKFGHIVKYIGFSGHHAGLGVDISAYTLGADFIERHFTLNRAWKGTDHAASLEPDGLRRLARDLNSTFAALRFKDKEILDIEDAQRKKLKRF